MKKNPLSKLSLVERSGTSLPSQGFCQFAAATTGLALFCLMANSETIYVWSGDETIRQFSTNGVGSVLVSNVAGWNGPVGLAVDGAGSLYSGCPGWSQVTKYDTNGIGSRVGYADSISALAFDNAGNLYGTIPNYAEVCKLHWNGIYFLHPTNGTQSHLNYPTSLVFDGEGNVYAANGVSPFPFGSSASYTNTIVRFSPDLTYLGDFATGLNMPWGLAFDQAGNLFVSNSGNYKIYRFTPGGVRSTFAANWLNKPRGIAFDSHGNLYVANAGNGTIVRFPPGGLVGTVFATGLNEPTSIAIWPGLRLWPIPATLTNPIMPLGGAFQFSFNYRVGTTFSALASTNAALPLSNWTSLGSVPEVSPGQFQFTDPQASNSPQRFYRVRSN